MNQLEELMGQIVCANCKRPWLGGYYGQPLCNLCAPVAALEPAFSDEEQDEPDGEDPDDEDECQVNMDEHYFLRPAFWQPLGKAMGWQMCEWGYCGRVKNKIYRGRPRKHCPVGHQPMWLKNWHRFIDHLGAGRNAAEFFERLS